MKPIKFKEANKVLTSPEKWDKKKHGNCGDLFVYNDGLQSISLWKLSWKQRFQVLLRGKVWLCVMGGTSQPPVWLDTNKTVFENY